jgi:intein-encoded DNA endonuclease-like protein
MSLDQSVKSVKELVKEFTSLSAIADKINASRNERMGISSILRWLHHGL